MNQLAALRTYLEQHFPRTTGTEEKCTCGAGNHVRVRFFRVDGNPVTAVIPEGADLAPDELREAVGCRSVGVLSEAEWDAIYDETELGSMVSFENPFGAAVLFDDLLINFADIVFCPRMFCGERGLCFRVPTDEFLNLTQALVLPLTTLACRATDDWAV